MKKNVQSQLRRYGYRPESNRAVTLEFMEYFFIKMYYIMKPYLVVLHMYYLLIQRFCM